GRSKDREASRLTLTRPQGSNRVTKETRNLHNYSRHALRKRCHLLILERDSADSFPDAASEEVARGLIPQSIACRACAAFKFSWAAFNASVSSAICSSFFLS